MTGATINRVKGVRFIYYHVVRPLYYVFALLIWKKSDTGIVCGHTSQNKSNFFMLKEEFSASGEGTALKNFIALTGSI